MHSTWGFLLFLGLYLFAYDSTRATSSCRHRMMSWKTAVGICPSTPPALPNNIFEEAVLFLDLTTPKIPQGPHLMSVPLANRPIIYVDNIPVVLFTRLEVGLLNKQHEIR